MTTADKTYEIANDAVSDTITASDANAAARKFAAAERYRNVQTVADLLAAAERCGGWCSVTEMTPTGPMLIDTTR